MRRYWVTLTAQNHIRRAIQDTREKWGQKQAVKYRQALQAGLQSIADNYHSFNSPHRESLANGTGYLLHLVEHRYVVFQEYCGDVIIAGLFHEYMDIPARLHELQNTSCDEISMIKVRINDTSS